MDRYYTFDNSFIIQYDIIIRNSRKLQAMKNEKVTQMVLYNSFLIIFKPSKLEVWDAFVGGFL